MSFIGLLRTLEQISRPPRLGHDVDVEDGAEQLTEREAETECLVPEDFNAVGRCVACVAEERAAEDELAADDEVTELWEPELNSSERVAVRQLIEERFGDQTTSGLDEARRQFGEWCASRSGDSTKSSASNHAGTGAEPAPSPTIVQSAPPPTVDGGAGGGGVLHSPGARLPHPDDDAALLEGFNCPRCDHDCDIDDDCDCHTCFVGFDGDPEDAAAEWIGEAVPVISEVLAEHVPHPDVASAVVSCCDSPSGKAHGHLSGWKTWRAHLAPIIAEALAAQQK